MCMQDVQPSFDEAKKSMSHMKQVIYNGNSSVLALELPINGGVFVCVSLIRRFHINGRIRKRM